MSVKNQVSILLTACVKPAERQRFNKVTDPGERLNQYLQALDFYICRTSLPIVFVDNSGVDISEFPEVRKHIISGRLEVLCYTADDFTKCKGKGYGEQDIIYKALQLSKTLKQSDYIIKITGRLKILNIKSFVKRISFTTRKDIFFGIRHWNIPWMFSYCYACPASFYDEDFFYKMRMVNEDDVNCLSFETVLHDIVMSRNGESLRFMHLIAPPVVDGILGATGRPYVTATSKERVKCLLSFMKYKLFKR